MGDQRALQRHDGLSAAESSGNLVTDCEHRGAVYYVVITW
jgi:hypothetical protein